MIFFIDSVLYSYAQIFFSNRRWFGFIILLVSFLTPLIGAFGLFGVITTNLIAYYLKFDSNKIRSGFYGFNGLLFSAAVGFFYDLSIELVLLLPVFILITFFITTVLEHYLAVAFNLPGLSLPFIVSFYVFSIFLFNYEGIELSKHLYKLDFALSLPKSVVIFFKSIGLIILQPSVLAGLIIIIAILFFSRVLFIISIISFLVNYYFLEIILPLKSDSLVIISSLNSILVGFAVGASLVIPSRKSVILVIISVIMTIISIGFFQQVFASTRLPIFVLPFNFIVLLVIYSLKFRKDHTDLTLLYFKPGSPEENYYYHHNQKARFEKFKYFFVELPFFGEMKVSQGFNGAYTHKDDWKYAWDFVSVDDNNNEFKNDGSKPEDYYCYDLPVIAPLDGEVVKIVDKILDNPIGDVNVEKNWGNTIVIKHSEDFYSAISHLKEGSFKVGVGEKVKKGSILARCGNSGRSPYPHIHFQFQLTDKIGEKTFKYPFGIYISKTENKKELKIFDFPSENELVKNIEVHKTIKNAFEFKLGNKYYFSYSKNNKMIEEEWEVKIDIYNLTYIENNSGDVAYFFLRDKLFYFTSYIGNKNSALYYFYLSAPLVPFTYEKDLSWVAPYSIRDLNNTNYIYLNELLLIYKNLLNAYGKINIIENPEIKNNFSIENEINTKGIGLFKFVNVQDKSIIFINDSGIISELNFYRNNKLIFNAKNQNQENK
ncbi:MAG: urea transporter [Ignavibacterium sp.]|nr:urea transporter [Ignavibacterium sp.]MDW8375117.1 urea transporter [Ignavibacteriales bacterium]